MKLMDILLELNRGQITALIEKYFHECIRKHFPEYKNYVGNEWPIPVFKLRSGTRTAGLFSYIPTGRTPMNQALTINPDFATDKFLRNIVFHETIHYVQANLSGMRMPPYDVQRYKVDHDSYFHEKMNDMNSVEGAGYITVTQDATQLDVAHKPFFLYGFVTQRNQYAYAWSVKESPQMKKWLETIGKEKYGRIFYFETSDYYFKTPKQQIRPSSFSYGSPDVKFGVVDNSEKERIIDPHIK